MEYKEGEIVDVYECGCGTLWQTDNFAEDCCSDEDYECKKGWYCYCEFKTGVAVLEHDECPYCRKKFALCTSDVTEAKNE